MGMLQAGLTNLDGGSYGIIPGHVWTIGRPATASSLKQSTERSYRSSRGGAQRISLGKEIPNGPTGLSGTLGMPPLVKTNDYKPHVGMVKTT